MGLLEVDEEVEGVVTVGQIVERGEGTVDDL